MERDDRNINVSYPIHVFNKNLPIRHIDEIDVKYNYEYNKHCITHLNRVNTRCHSMNIECPKHRRFLRYFEDATSNIYEFLSCKVSHSGNDWTVMENNDFIITDNDN